MSDKREFLQRDPLNVLLPLDAGSDIHYGGRHKNTQACLLLNRQREKLTEKKLKNSHV